MERFDNNPLLRPEDVEPTRPGLDILCVLNPAAVRFGDEVLLLVRVGEAATQPEDAVAILTYDSVAADVTVRYIPRDDPALRQRDGRGWFYQGKVLLTSMSHLRIARSKDGRTFTIDPEPAIYPSNDYEAHGCEDARITCLDGKYWICYTAVSRMGVTVALASTEDWVHFKKHGIIFPPFQKDVCLFPEKIRGLYVARHRPFTSLYNDACIWTAYSPDLLSWGRHSMTMEPGPGTWTSQRIGAGPPPVRTDAGWLEIYHAADETSRYGLGAMLSHPEHPERVLHASSRPILEPVEEYEHRGVFGNVVFCNGWLVDDDGTITLYYGAADTVCCGANTTVGEMIAAAKE